MSLLSGGINNDKRKCNMTDNKKEPIDMNLYEEIIKLNKDYSDIIHLINTGYLTLENLEDLEMRKGKDRVDRLLEALRNLYDL